MKKLALKLDDLEVESFETMEMKTGTGTVLAHNSTGAEIICGCTGKSCDGCGGLSATCASSGLNTHDDGCESLEYCG